MQDATRYALYAVGLVVLAAAVYGFMGLTTPRGESSYTGQVVDVVEDKGFVLKPTYANMKTQRRSSTQEQFCILDSRRQEQLPKLYDALESGDRVTVRYSAPMWVNPTQCGSGDMAIIHSVTATNQTGGGE